MEVNTGRWGHSRACFGRMRSALGEEVAVLICCPAVRAPELRHLGSVGSHRPRLAPPVGVNLLFDVGHWHGSQTLPGCLSHRLGRFFLEQFSKLEHKQPLPFVPSWTGQYAISATSGRDGQGQAIYVHARQEQGQGLRRPTPALSRLIGQMERTQAGISPRHRPPTGSGHGSCSRSPLRGSARPRT